MVPQYDITDPALADRGRRRIEWADSEMPVLAAIRRDFASARPLTGVRISGCLHITTETANLARTLAAAGAKVVLCASNPLSTQDDTAAALVVHYGVSVFARRGVSTKGYYRHISAALDHRPRFTLDDGADLVSQAHRRGGDTLAAIAGGTEETTTGVTRLRAMADEGALVYPIIAVNDANTKHLFDNRYGTGQSTIDGILRATNLLLAGTVFVVAGYGWCGRGLATRARGMGARVVVTEVSPLRALEAVMDGYAVMPMLEAARVADLIVTVTGGKHAVGASHLAVLKDGCVLANSGHFDVEIDKRALDAITVSRTRPRAEVEESVTADGRRIRLLSEGRLVNLAAAEGHPAAVMDMSFANQALCVLHLADASLALPPGVHPVPRSIDEQVAAHKLAAMGIGIDAMTAEQADYGASWREGTE